MKKRRIVFSLGLLLVLAMATAYVVITTGATGAPVAAAAPAVPVVVAPAEMAELVLRVEAIGTAKANESVSLSATSTARVTAIHFDDGMLVEAGKVLVELDDDEEHAQLATEQAALREAESGLAEGRGNLEAQRALLAEAKAALAEREKGLARFRELRPGGSVSEAQLDEQTMFVETSQAKVESAAALVRAAEAGLVAAQARVESAQSRVVAIEARLDDLDIVAPFNGVLGFRRVSVGAVVAAGDELGTIDDLEIIKLDFPVPEKHVSILQPGLTVEARSVAYPDRAFRGTVETIGSRVDPVTRAVAVRALIQNPEHLIRPGMLFQVDLIQSRRSTLTVPEEAIVSLGTQRYVFGVDAENRARRIEVRTGDRQPGIVEILEGITPGELVVVEGTVRLAPGTPVEVVETRPGVRPQPASSRPASEGGEPK